MARTGYIITVYQDINPSSPTYNQTREERVIDETNCPSSEPSNWIEDTKYCEMNETGMNSGYEITVYRDVAPLSPTYNQTREERILNTTDCVADSTNPEWVNIGDTFCRQIVYMPGGLLGNDGYIVQQQEDVNEYSPTYEQIRDIPTQDLEHCPLPNTEPVYDIISEACHTVSEGGLVVYDGTKDIIRVDTNQYSATWNNNIPESVNVPDLENCTPSSSHEPIWVDIDEYCQLDYEGENTGVKVVIQQDSNPLSPTYQQTREQTEEDYTTCPAFIFENLSQYSYDIDWNENPFSIQILSYYRDNVTDQTYDFSKVTESDGDWLTIGHTSVSDLTHITSMFLSFARNETLQPRTGYAKFTQNSSGKKITITIRQGGKPDYSGNYLTFKALEDGTFGFSGENSNILSYSLDNGQTWTALASGTSSPTVTAGNEIMWKGITTPTTNLGIGSFYSTGNFDVYGNAMSIAYGDNFQGQTTMSDYQFAGLFSPCTKLINAENLVLPSTTLSQGCYEGMFYGCRALVSTPELNAMTLAKWCYENMFYGCSSLVTPPDLPATILADSCYHSMFRGCSSIVNAPVLPAAVVNASSYSDMFYNCTSLQNIICLATDISSHWSTSSWTKNVSATGTFTKAASMSSWTSGIDGIPTGWTVQNQ